MVTYERTCPCCASGRIYKSHFRNLEILMPLWLLRPVRCGQCEVRYYRPIFYRARRRPCGAQPNSQEGTANVTRP